MYVLKKSRKPTKKSRSEQRAGGERRRRESEWRRTMVPVMAVEILSVKQKNKTKQKHKREEF